MRLSTLLVLSLLTFVSAAIAQDQPQLTRSPTTETEWQEDVKPGFELFPDARTDVLTKFNSIAEGGAGSPVEAQARSHSVQFYGENEIRQNLCFKMRTYIVAREERHSDRTRLVGYRTCLPGSDLEMRNADAWAPSTGERSR